MRDFVRRVIRCRPELAAELLRRGIFDAEEKREFLDYILGQGGSVGTPLGPVQFASLLADADAQLAARAVLRDVVDSEELGWLYRLLKFQKPNQKRDELTRIVERAMEGRKGNAL
jgi:hypothetical protein